MGKTHEALQRAEKSYFSYQDLKTNLMTRRVMKGYPQAGVKSILFVGASKGDGVTTTAVLLASQFAEDPEMRVLVVDMNMHNPSLHKVFGLDQSPGFTDYLISEEDASIHTHRLRSGNLAIITHGADQAGRKLLTKAALLDRFLKKAADNFDYIILDGPPAPNFAELRLICPRVDGVVLVIQAGKTRRQIAQRLKKEIEDVGGKPVGVVLNKRKYYVPGWIYRRC